MASLILALCFLPSGVASAQRVPEEPPYIPTETELVDAMLHLGRVTADDVLYDLGSGDGRIVIRAAQRFGTRGVGYEHQQPLVEFSRLAAARHGVSDLVRFHAEDLFEADLTSASVVTLYLGAAFNLRLRPILLNQLRPASRVVSNNFHMGDWRPDSTVHIGSGATRATLYLWEIPARVDGFWTLAVEGEPVAHALELLQRFQTATGTARADGRAHPVQDVRLRGERIHFRFRLDDSGMTHFQGRVSGDRMEGIATTPAGPRRWIALRLNHPGLAPQ